MNVICHRNVTIINSLPRIMMTVLFSIYIKTFYKVQTPYQLHAQRFNWYDPNWKVKESGSEASPKMVHRLPLVKKKKTKKTHTHRKE